MYCDYPDELKGQGWLINFQKKPINYKAVLEMHPSIEDLSKTQGNLYLNRGWQHDDGLTLELAEKVLVAIQKLYPDDINKFALGLLCSKYPQYIFFEWDDSQEPGADTYGQGDFFKYCMSMGYHVPKSTNGNMHYVMELPDFLEQADPFQWQENKGIDNHNEFEVKYCKGQWNETGQLHSKGSIIPADDKTALQFIKARYDRRQAYKGNDSTRSISTTASRAAPGQELHPDIEPTAPTTNLLSQSVDEKFIADIFENCKGSLKFNLISINTQKYKYDALKADLSSYLMSLTDTLYKAGVPNYATYRAVVEKSALHEIYKMKPDYKEKWTEHKLEVTYNEAILKLKDRIYRAIPNKLGEQRKEVSRAINHYNEISENLILYSEPSGSAIRITGGEEKPVLPEDVLCDITTDNFEWVGRNGDNTTPSIYAVKSALSTANLPVIKYVTSGGWIDTEGNIICTKGYHNGYYLTQDIKIKPIPTVITDTERHEALITLYRAFEGFLFKDFTSGIQDCIYFIFCMFLHPSIQTAIPALIINKNKARIGGSTLSEVLLMLRHNCDIDDPTALRATEEGCTDTILAEVRKHNKGYAYFDNLTNSNVFGQVGLMLHSGRGAVSGRLKYGKLTSTINLKKDIVYNGNNVAIGADFTQRALEVKLWFEGDSSEITFNNNIDDVKKYARTRHPDVLRAVAIAVRSWIQEGRPEPTQTPSANWNEYAAYHKIIAGSMEQLKMTNYLQNLRETQVDNNYKSNQHIERLVALEKAFEHDIFSSVDVFTRCEKAKGSNLNLDNPELRGCYDLRQVFGDLKGKSLTTVLKSMVDVGKVADCDMYLQVSECKAGNRMHFQIYTAPTPTHTNVDEGRRD